MGCGRAEDVVRHLLQRRRQGVRDGGAAKRGRHGERAAGHEHGNPAGERKPDTRPGPADGTRERGYGRVLSGQLRGHGRARRRLEHKRERLQVRRGVGPGLVAGQQSLGGRLVWRHPVVVPGKNWHLSR